jgi:hypothetical protein
VPTILQPHDFQHTIIALLFPKTLLHSADGFQLQQHSFNKVHPTRIWHS